MIKITTQAIIYWIGLFDLSLRGVKSVFRFSVLYFLMKAQHRHRTLFKVPTEFLTPVRYPDYFCLLYRTGSIHGWHKVTGVFWTLLNSSE